MKKTILAIAMLFATMISAQDFYATLGTGAGVVAGPRKLSSTTTDTGSYGEGLQTQVRFGYKVTEKIGIDLGVGYLIGKGQHFSVGEDVKIIGRARAFGASLAGMYDITKNLYVRAGLLTKVGGKTEVFANVNKGPVDLKIERANNGKFPVGFMGAMGVQFEIADNLSLFGEFEYQGINVTSNKSKLVSIDGTYNGKKVTSNGVFIKDISKVKGAAALGLIPAKTAQEMIGSLVSLAGLTAEEITYVENPSKNPTDYEAKAIDAPYSSFGFSIGFIYSFDFGTKK